VRAGRPEAARRSLQGALRHDPTLAGRALADSMLAPLLPAIR
jgi:hypothetical protein